MHTGRVVPVYPLAAGVTQKRVRELLARILERALPALDDPLTAEERGVLPALADALYAAHFPEDAADVPAALDRLAFDELLALQLTLAQARRARQSLRAARVMVADEELDALLAALPFELTGDQRSAVNEVIADLAADRPMRRLLQGDVGSGKTAVAAVALAGAVRAGWQGALMAPTEILARQHHDGLAPLLEALGVRAEFLSGSLKAAEQGTHPRRDRGGRGRGGDRHPRGHQRGGRVPQPRPGRGRRAAPLRRRAARRAAGQGRRAWSRMCWR